MPAPSDLIIQLLWAFRTATTRPTFVRMCLLMQGAILAPARRTISAALAAVGLEQAADFSNYHEVFNRARWSPLRMSAILLNLLIEAFVPANAPLELLVDETLERRRGRKIRWKSVFRDAVLSTAEHLTLAYGIRWVCMCLLVRMPWSQRPWALPFLVVPSLSEKRAKLLGKPYRSPSQWAARMVQRVRRWQPQRQIVLVGDGTYAAQDLVAACQSLPTPVVLVCRLRMDAVLYDPPAPQPRSKRGPKPQKGARRPSFQQCLAEAHTPWQKAQVPWYGGQVYPVEYTTGVALWYQKAAGCLQVRWVLLRGAGPAADTFQPAALLCSDASVPAEQVIASFVRRWNVEVTFEEMRACLGLETQRHWSAKAIGRTTPALFALFSLVALLANRLHPHPHSLPVQQRRWYAKEEPTFRDALAAVRLHLLAFAVHEPDGPSHRHCSRSRYRQSGNSTPEQELCLIPVALLRSLQKAICYAS